MPVLRISRATYLADAYEDVRAHLETTRAKLEPVLRGLDGFQHYYVAIDQTSKTITHVSIWATLADAKQLDSLPAMLVHAGEMVGLGVSFERPTNNDILWEL